MRFQLALLLWIHLVSGFSFNIGTPTECDNLDIDWTGGQPPFQLLVTPELGAALNFSIPDGETTFKLQLTLPHNTNFLLTMSDATGFGTGGTSSLLTVGPSLGGSCNAALDRPDFFFSANLALNQCRTYTFSNYTGSLRPITILGLIPAGQNFILQADQPTFDWVANVAGRTSIMFTMFDSLGRNGGVSAINIVGPSDDSTCLDASSPSSTSMVSSSTTSRNTPTPTPTPTTPDPSPTGTAVSAGVIAGTVLGGLILFAALITLGVFFIRKYLRKKGSGRTYDDPYANDRIPQHHRMESRVNSPPHQLEHQSNPYPYSGSTGHPDALSTQFLLSEQYAPTPFVFPPAQGHTPSHSYASSSADDPSLPFNPSSSSTSSARQKAAAAGVSNYTPSRFILHTDAEEIPPDQNDIIELPPQYSANRAPLPPNILPDLPPPPPQQHQVPGTSHQIVEKSGHGFV